MKLVGCNTADSNLQAKEVSAGIIVDYDSNILMNIYDIRISVNDVVLGVQKQGETTLYDLTIKEGRNTLILSEFGNDENIQQESFNVTEGKYYYFFIKTRDSGIEIERKDIMSRDEALLLEGIVVVGAKDETDSNEAVVDDSAEIIPEKTDDSSDSSSDIESNNDCDFEHWKSEYINRINGGLEFGLYDMGATYPVLIVRKGTDLRGDRYTTYGFYNGDIFTLNEDGGSLISYENGFISIMTKKGSDDDFTGFYIDDLLEFLYEYGDENIGSRDSIGEAGLYRYYMHFGKDNAGNYFANNMLERMSLEDSTALFLELKEKAEQMTTIETWTLSNTDASLIKEWGN